MKWKPITDICILVPILIDKTIIIISISGSFTFFMIPLMEVQILLDPSFRFLSHSFLYLVFDMVLAFLAKVCLLIARFLTYSNRLIFNQPQPPYNIFNRFLTFILIFFKPALPSWTHCLM